MTGSTTPLERLRRLVKEDPRSAILLHEVLGPPPGLRKPGAPGD